MQTHLKEAENTLNNITVAIKQVVSKLLPTKPQNQDYLCLTKTT